LQAIYPKTGTALTHFSLPQFIDRFPIGILTFGWIVAIVLVNPIGDFPLNDDWQYAYPVQQLIETGQIGFTGRFAPNIFLQVAWGYVWSWAYGAFSYTILRLSVLTLGWVGGLLVFRTGKLLSLSTPLSLLLSACLLFNPLYFNLSFSFMTDVPFLVVVLFSLYCWLRYEKKGERVAFAGAVILAMGSFLIRQPGILLLPLYAGALLFPASGKKRQWFAALAVLALTVLLYLGVEKGLKPYLGIIDNYVPVGSIYLEIIFDNPLSFISQQAKQFLKTLIFLGFFSLPLAPFFWKKMKQMGLFRIKIMAPVIIGNVLLLLLLVKVGKTFPFGGNILFNAGLGPELLIDRYKFDLPHTPQLPEVVMLAIQLLAQVWMTLLVARSWSSARLLRGAPAPRYQYRFFLLLLLLNLPYLFLMSIFSYFDRYLLLPVVSSFFFIGWLARDARLGKTWSFIPLFLFGLFSLLATKDYLNWNRARAQAFEFLQNESVSIKEMDAGYEYNGLYNYQPDFQDPPDQSWWWVDEDDYLITFGPVEGFEVVKTFPYRRWLSGETNEILILKQMR